MADLKKVMTLEYDTKKAQTALRRLGITMRKVNKEAERAGDKFEKFIGVKGSKAVNRLNKNLKKTELNLKTVRGGLDKVSRKLAIASAAFAGLGAVSIKNSLELNKSMANVSTLLSGGIDQVNGLKAGVQDMAKATGKSTTDLADGLYDVVSALGESADNVKQLDIASRASVAGLSTTKEAIGLLTATTKGYGDTSNEAMKKVSDLAFQTVKLGVTTFPELASSMGKVIPLAAAMGTKQTELFGTMATLTGVTGTASEVTTQLASVYASFLKPTEQMTKLAKKQGFETASAMLKSKGLAETIKILRKETKGEADQVAKFIRRKEGQIAVLALTGGQADTYITKLAAMEQASGATAEAFRKQTEGINKQGHSWEKTKQRMIVFSQRLGDKLVPILSRLLDKLEPVLSYIENMSDETMDSWIALGKWVAIMAVATKALSGFLGVVEGLGSLKELTTGISSVSSGMSALPGQVGKATSALSKFGAVAGALAGGVAIGTAITDIALAPQQKGRYRKEDTLAEQAVQAKNLARAAGGTAEKESALKRLQESRTRFRKEAGQVGFAEVAGGIASAFTGLPSPGEMRGRVTKQTAEAERKLKESIEADKLESWLQTGRGEYQVSAPKTPVAGKSVQGGGTTNNIEIKVNAKSNDARGIAREIKREFSRELGTEARGEAAAEQ